jgi:hypothetical protein
VGEEQVDDAVGVERAGVRTELVVGPYEVGGLAGQHGEEPLQRLPVEGFLEVLDDVELDVALLEDAEGATGLASTRVVVQQQAVAHGDDPRNKSSIRSKWPRPAAGVDVDCGRGRAGLVCGGVEEPGGDCEGVLEHWIWRFTSSASQSAGLVSYCDQAHGNRLNEGDR